ncbi:MAG: RNA-guided endonuclease InsQ/TnpB family protein, partial [Sarcina sp.]
DLGKMLTILKKEEEFKWLNEAFANSLKEALRDLGKAYTEFFEIQKKGSKYTKKTIEKAKRKGIKLSVYDLNGHPKFKKKRYSKQKYYCRYDKLYFTESLCNVEKIGKIKYKSSYKIDLSVINKFSNPRIEFINNKWILSFGISDIVEKEKLTNVSLGVDLGISNLAICSDEKLNAKNINKTLTIKKLKKKYKRLQKQSSRKYLMNNNLKTNNNLKLEKKLRKIQTRLNNIRINHLHKSTTAMVKTKPCRIVIEDLNVKGMMSNKHLSKAIAEQGFRKFRDILEYKCKRQEIDFVLADRWYPSSKTCSKCGCIKKDLKLSDRVYKCSCGLIINRDLNAAINLSRYGLEITP